MPRAALALVLLALAAGTSRAEPLVAAPPARFVDVTSATLPPRDGVAAVGVGHRGERFAQVEFPFTELAAVGVGVDDRFVAGPTAADAMAAGAKVAWFRVGVPADRQFHGQPAVDLGLRRTFGDSIGGERLGGPPTRAVVAELSVGVTWRVRHRRLGALTVHAGASLWDARSGDPDAPAARMARALGARARPAVAISWTPPSVPRTTLLVEHSSAPVLLPTSIELAPRIGWGVRYQVWSWLAIDLAVRHRLEASLDTSTVMVRLAATLPR